MGKLTDDMNLHIMLDMQRRIQELTYRLAAQVKEVDKANELIDELRDERNLLQRLAGERGNKLEAAEAKVIKLNDGWLTAIAQRDEARVEQGKLEAARGVKNIWKERAWSAEEKLAELENLVPIRAPIEVISIIENSVNGPVYDEGVQAIWSGCIEYMLRNIEGGAK